MSNRKIWDYITEKAVTDDIFYSFWKSHAFGVSKEDVILEMLKCVTKQRDLYLTELTKAHELIVPMIGRK